MKSAAIVGADDWDRVLTLRCLPPAALPQHESRAFVLCKRFFVEREGGSGGGQLDLEAAQVVLQLMQTFQAAAAVAAEEAEQVEAASTTTLGSSGETEWTSVDWKPLLQVAEAAVQHLHAVRRTVRQQELRRLGPCSLTLTVLDAPAPAAASRKEGSAESASEAAVCLQAAEALREGGGGAGAGARDAVHALGWGSGRLLLQEQPAMTSQQQALLLERLLLQPRGKGGRSAGEAPLLPLVEPESVVPLLGAHLDCCLHDHDADPRSADETRAAGALLQAGLAGLLPPALLPAGRTLLARSPCPPALLPALALAGCLAHAMRDSYCDATEAARGGSTSLHYRVLALLATLRDLCPRHPQLLLAVLRVAAAQLLLALPSQAATLLQPLVQLASAVQRLLRITDAQLLGGLAGVVSAAALRQELLSARQAGGAPLQADSLGCAVLLQRMSVPSSATEATAWLVAELREHPSAAEGMLRASASLLSTPGPAAAALLAAGAAARVLALIKQACAAAQVPESRLAGPLALLEAAVETHTAVRAAAAASFAPRVHTEPQAGLWGRVRALELRARAAVDEGGEAALLALALEPDMSAQELDHCAAGLLCAAYDAGDACLFDAAGALLSRDAVDALERLGAEVETTETVAGGASTLRRMPLELALRHAGLGAVDRAAAAPRVCFPRRHSRLSLDLALSAWPAPPPGSATDLCSATLGVIHAVAAATEATGAAAVSPGLMECLRMYCILFCAPAAAHALGLALRRLALLPPQTAVARRQAAYVAACLAVLHACAESGSLSLAAALRLAFDRSTESSLYRALLLPCGGDGGEEDTEENDVVRVELQTAVVNCLQALSGEPDAEAGAPPRQLLAVSTIMLAAGCAPATAAALQAAICRWGEGAPFDAAAAVAADGDWRWCPPLTHVLACLMQETPADEPCKADRHRRGQLAATDRAAGSAVWTHRVLRLLDRTCQPMRGDIAQRRSSDEAAAAAARDGAGKAAREECTDTSPVSTPRSLSAASLPNTPSSAASGLSVRSVVRSSVRRRTPPPAVLGNGGGSLGSLDAAAVRSEASAVAEDIARTPMKPHPEPLSFPAGLPAARATAAACSPVSTAPRPAAHTRQLEEPVPVSVAGHKRVRPPDAAAAGAAEPETWAAGEAAKKFNLGF